MSYHDQLIELANKLEKEHVGKTIVLNANTFETIIISDNHAEIGEVIKKLDKDVVTLFLGGPYPESTRGFFNFC